MALPDVYKQFLAAPNPSLLASDAALHYVTTTTTFRGAADIIKHLNTQQNQIKKKKQEFLTVIEGQNAVAIEVHTVLEFVTSGGSYLPGLDDNFLADHTVDLPVTHIVTFNAEGKISQMRQTWDQGSLLKQLDIIGKSGRNWPIRDAKDQIKMIESSLKAGDNIIPAKDDGNSARVRANTNNAMRDPHASLSLFAPREETEQQAMASVISPKAGGARPRQRDFAEILGDEPVGEAGSPSAGRHRSDSPSKAIAPKIGAGKNYQPSRLFDREEDVPDEPESPGNGNSQKFYRPNPKKYNHFDFADGSDPQDAPRAADPTPKKTKHSSQWNFEDFTTPAKARPGKTLQKSHQDVRHWGNEDDVVEDGPNGKPAAVKPRRDAEAHFEFVDDGEPQVDPRPSRPRGATHNTGLGLYKNNVYREEGEASEDAADQQALGNITNLKNRGKTFGAQFAMTDESPSQMPERGQVAQDRMKAVKMMDANWAATDESPSQKENLPTRPKETAAKGGGERGIHIGGDGMGGSRGTVRDWLYGDDDDQPAKPAPGRKQGASKTGGFNWDF
ncbi:hypothetical protein JX265_006201 [Neoarthrinium moseri]|uniref:NTF2-like protein n=1 Tax=Neoarthrinium moseri TaxID=1658444 RepID=A0A9P9WLW6_9PEZI|nr:uncharacterized protein JN550_012719 [Neoarthrinium moseri]KAI1843375.1 hypothetical protein JX266_010372 [Neoarthrinium moseri]KAI1858354.1 hypothetical protein JN550_012719 [Neoarthrinium moseri]KAI1870031.1 hypothetical protein JX265_006201 [Neoarthrinium moseri]